MKAPIDFTACDRPIGGTKPNVRFAGEWMLYLVLMMAVTTALFDGAVRVAGATIA